MPGTHLRDLPRPVCVALSVKIVATFSTILCQRNRLYERFKSLHKILAVTKVCSS